MRASAALLAALALAGCGGESTTDSAARTGEVALENATIAEVANQTAAAQASGAMRFDPGEWETAVEITEFAIPGMPPEVAQQMKGAFDGATKVTRCMTREEAERPNADIFAGKSDNCRFGKYEMKGGRIDATMTCAGGAGGAGAAEVAMVGSYAATSFDMRSDVTAKGAPGGGDVKMKMHVTGRRLGACKS